MFTFLPNFTPKIIRMILVFVCIVFLGLVFFLMGFLVTEKNAKYTLSMYRSMSEEHRQQLDIKPFIVFFRQFHFFFGISFAVLGTLILFIFGIACVAVFLTVYLIAVYTYFVIKSFRFWKAKVDFKADFKQNRLPLFIGLGFTLFTAIVLWIGLETIGLKEPVAILYTDAVVFQGYHKETISFSDIQSVELINQLPSMIRVNGFALRKIKKGMFRTSDGETIKLFLNTTVNPYLYIATKSGKKVYFSSSKQSNEMLYGEIQKQVEFTNTVK